MDNSWYLYNKSILSSKPPHAKIKTEDAKNTLKNSNALFVRYTSNFDCEVETEWWYCICDKKVDLDSMKSKERSEINKGLRNCNAKIIKFSDYTEEIWNVYSESASRYNNYKILSKDKYLNDMFSLNDTNNDLWGVFLSESNKLIGYGIVSKKEYSNIYCASINVLKFIPEFFRFGSSACLIYTLTNFYLDDMSYGYVYNGERSIRHDTNIQNYMMKLFGYRKAFCVLNIYYKFYVRFILFFIIPFKLIITKLSLKNSFFNDIESLLNQHHYSKLTIKKYGSHDCIHN